MPPNCNWGTSCGIPGIQPQVMDFKKDVDRFWHWKCLNIFEKKHSRKWSSNKNYSSVCYLGRVVNMIINIVVIMSIQVIITVIISVQDWYYFTFGFVQTVL